MADVRSIVRGPAGAVLNLVCVVLIAVLPSCSGEQPARDPQTDIDPQANTTLAGRNKSLPCLACHGAEGISDYDAWPDLAGQKAEYLAKQLRDFRDGRRQDPWMSPMAIVLDDQDIDDLAVYFSRIDGLSGGPDSVPQPATVCVACHAARSGEANPLWPSIAGQNRRYIAKQLGDFRAGRRTDPIMAPLAGGLTDQDIETLAAFYAGT
jgi:cytochrome c553